MIKKYNHRLRQETLDQDYLEKLNEEELAWLNKFMEEYNNDNYVTVNGKLDENGIRILDPEQNIHQTQQHKKALDDANNARNRDLFGHLRNKSDKFNSSKLLNYDAIIGDIENHLSRDINPTALEDAYIDFLECEQIEQMLKEYDEALANLPKFEDA